MEDVFNISHACKVELEVLGYELLLAQDPNSKHLGTTVWDSSMMFVKFLEKNSKKGEFSRAKLQHKCVIELGAGCGLSGLDRPHFSVWLHHRHRRGVQGAYIAAFA